MHRYSFATNALIRASSVYVHEKVLVLTRFIDFFLELYDGHIRVLFFLLGCLTHAIPRSARICCLGCDFLNNCRIHRLPYPYPLLCRYDFSRNFWTVCCAFIVPYRVRCLPCREVVATSWKGTAQGSGEGRILIISTGTCATASDVIV